MFSLLSYYITTTLFLLTTPQGSDAFGFQNTKVSLRFPELNLQLGNANNVCQDALTATIATLSITSLAAPAIAVSGGGLDYAGLDISGQDFSNNSKTYKGKDFTQVLAKATNFANSNFQGCRFYKAYLVNTDFSNSDIRGVS